MKLNINVLSQLSKSPVPHFIYCILYIAFLFEPTQILKTEASFQTCHLFSLFAEYFQPSLLFQTVVYYLHTEVHHFFRMKSADTTRATSDTVHVMPRDASVKGITN